MPQPFTQSFATHLQLRSPLTVVHANDLMPVFPATVYIGCGDRHLRVRRYGRERVLVEVGQEPHDLPCKPSVDELFRSCASVYGAHTLGIVMTGTGTDGTQGAGAVRRAGGVIITQAQATCAAYDMPGSCVDAGLSDAQLDPDQIRLAILQLSPQHRKKSSA